MLMGFGCVGVPVCYQSVDCSSKCCYRSGSLEWPKYMVPYFATAVVDYFMYKKKFCDLITPSRDRLQLQPRKASILHGSHYQPKRRKKRKEVCKHE